MTMLGSCPTRRLIPQKVKKLILCLFNAKIRYGQERLVKEAENASPHPDDMKSRILAERARYLKESDKGVRHMCRIMEEFAKEERKEGRDERTIEMAAKLLESGDMTEERIKELFKLTEKQMKAIKERVAVLA